MFAFDQSAALCRVGTLFCRRSSPSDQHGSAVIQNTVGQRVGPNPSHMKEHKMLRKITTLAIIAGSLTVAACNTVRGAAADVNSVANKVDNAT